MAPDITKVDANRHLNPTVYPHMAVSGQSDFLPEWPTVCGNQQRGGSFDSVWRKKPRQTPLRMTNIT
jgi:hypothetical protein